MSLLASWISDLRFGLRQFRKAPRFHALVLALLVLGIGATTAMFSLLWALVLRPLPYREPEQLLMVWGRHADASGSDGFDELPVPLSLYSAWSERASTLQQVAAVDTWLYSFGSEGQPPEGLIAAKVSGTFFPMLGVQPVLGRLIEPDDDRKGARGVVVLGSALWQRRFGSDPLIVGKTVQLDARPYTVIGVAPEGFDFSFPGSPPAAFWTPRSVFPRGPDGRAEDLYENPEIRVIARRRPEATLDQVRSELVRIAASSAASASESERLEIRVQSLGRAVVSDNLSPLLMRFGAVTLVFLAICTNVSSLLSLQAEARRGEFALRAAFGASRARLARQVSTETLLLFLLAAPLSALAASLLVGVFRDFSVQPLSTLAQVDVTLEVPALIFCLLAALIAGSLSAVLPALVAGRSDLFSLLKQVGSGSSRGSSTSLLRSGLVVAQVALAFAISSGSGLASLALVSALRTPLGFDFDGLVCAPLTGLPEFYLPSRDGPETLRRVMQRIAAEPGVQSVAANASMPFAGYYVQDELEVRGRATPLPTQSRLNATWNWVTPNYFDTLRMPLVRGRGLLLADGSDSAPVAVVSQRVAEAYFPNQEPIGQYIRGASGQDSDFREIVGVVADIRREGPSHPIAREVYTPLAQETGAAAIVVRTDQPERLAKALPALVASVDPALGVRGRQMTQRVRDSLSESYRLSALLGFFAGLALLLATVGLYALVSHATTLRTREFGIRTALGSSPFQLSWLIMRGALGWLGLGSVLGLLGAWALGRLLALGLPGGSGFDVRVCAVVALALALAGGCASYLPARRAVRASPASALRYE